MTKAIFKIALVFVGMLMLSLSVLPHHHHDQITHFSFVWYGNCHEATAMADADACSHNTCSEHGEEDENCDIKHIFVVSGRDDQSFTACQTDCNLDTHPWHLFTLILDLTHTFHIEVKEPLRFVLPTFADPLQSHYAALPRALRAPPVFIA